MKAIQKRLLSLQERNDSFALQKVFESLFNNQVLSSAALTGGASSTVTTGATFSAVCNGLLVSKASGASMAVLNGPTIQNTGANCQAWVFTMDAVGAFYTLPGVPATTIAGIQLPIIQDVASSGLPQVVIGMLTINNTSVGAFVPASTLLNVAGLNVVFSNTVGPFFPIQIL